MPDGAPGKKTMIEGLIPYRTQTPGLRRQKRKKQNKIKKKKNKNKKNIRDNQSNEPIHCVTNDKCFLFENVLFVTSRRDFQGYKLFMSTIPPMLNSVYACIVENFAHFVQPIFLHIIKSFAYIPRQIHIWLTLA